MSLLHAAEATRSFENDVRRVRRLARRHGLVLRFSRRDGGYYLIDDGNRVLHPRAVSLEAASDLVCAATLGEPPSRW